MPAWTGMTTRRTARLTFGRVEQEQAGDQDQPEEDRGPDDPAASDAKGQWARD